MRFFKRKKKENDEPLDSQKTEKRISSLGIFSPVYSQTESNPMHESKRLAELEHIFVRSKRLESLDDVPFVVNQIRDGNIVLLDISRLNNGQEQNALELKRIIERIRGETRGFQADLALVNDSCVIVTPPFVKM
jgi:SepF-like predicted cell division protein (DUF552 family)